MDLREYMSIRRAYNHVRQESGASSRLTFEEFAILCRLEIVDAPLKTSAIAEYQGALRPTMTHRTNHLAKLGFIDRSEGMEDRRNIVCSISDDGRQHVRELAKRTCGRIPIGQPLARTSAERICKYVDAMGSVYCTAGELVLLALLMEQGEPCTVTHLVDVLGLLQPTVSMSITSFVDRGLVERLYEDVSRRSGSVLLTTDGKVRAQDIASSISSIVVRRRSRT